MKNNDLTQQILLLSKIFDLNPANALKYANDLPSLESFVPENAISHTKYCAIIQEQNDPGEYYDIRYCRALTYLLRRLGQSRPSEFNWYGREITPNNFKVSAEPKTMGNDNIIVVATQFNGYHQLNEEERGMGALGITSLLATGQIPKNARLVICSGGERIKFGARDKNYSNIPCFQLTSRDERTLASFAQIGRIITDKFVCAPSLFLSH